MDFIIEFVLGVAFFFVLIRIVKHMKNRKQQSLCFSMLEVSQYELST